MLFYLWSTLFYCHSSRKVNKMDITTSCPLLVVMACEGFNSFHQYPSTSRSSQGERHLSINEKIISLEMCPSNEQLISEDDQEVLYWIFVLFLSF